MFDRTDLQALAQPNTAIVAKILYDEPTPLLNPNGSIQKRGIPLIVVWLVLGAVFFSIRMKFINFRGVRHAISLIRGKYDDPANKGEVSHFQALTTALSGTVGLGNIAGVAVAIAVGGAGATFWMIVAGILGMASKFTECTLGVKYRYINEKGEVSGGPMYYLSRGLAMRKMRGFGKVLAGLFAILCIGASFGGGNMFQANQAFAQVVTKVPYFQGNGALFGVILAVLIGLVIVGGIKSIAKVTDKIVPFMGVLYVGIALLFGARAGFQLGVGHRHFLARQQGVEVVVGIAGRGRRHRGRQRGVLVGGAGGRRRGGVGIGAGAIEAVVAV